MRLLASEDRAMIPRLRLAFPTLAFALAFVSLLPRVEAQAQPVPPFAGALTESFESGATFQQVCYPPGVFLGTAELCAPSGPFLGVGMSSSCSCTSCQITPYAGTLMCVTPMGTVELRFDSNVAQFGGRFATFGTGAFQIYFHDIDDRLVHVGFQPAPGGCTWTWFGWDLSALPPIRRVVVEATTSQFLFPDFLALDDLQLDYAPPGPTPYCSSGSTSSGCVATISADANPKVGHGSSCRITVSSVEGRRRGSVFYGLARQDIPWCTGGLGTSRRPHGLRRDHRSL
jgi:hypothetical protein